MSLGPSPPPPPDGLGSLIWSIRTNRQTHIIILGTVCAVLLGFQALLGSRRRRCGRKAFLLPLWVAYTISYSVVSYTIGLVQSEREPGWNSSQLLVWALGMLLLLGSADSLSAFSRHDVEQSKGMQAQHVLQALLVLWLFVSSTGDSGTWVFHLLIVLCWLYSIFKMAKRIKALRMASSSHGLMRSAKVVADYMHVTVQKESESDRRRRTPGGLRDMSEYKYLVHGEDEHSQPPSRPGYRTHIPVGDDNHKVITIDKIWKHDGRLLSSDDTLARALKDTCLSFALFKLLKRRFCGLEIVEAGLPKTRDFVFEGLLADPADQERALRVVDLELSFLYDLFYTKYPALFSTNTNIALAIVRIIFLVRFLLMLLYCLTLVAEATLRSEDRSRDLGFVFTNFNNSLFYGLIVATDVLQPLAAWYSDWAVVDFVCNHVRNKGKKGWDCGIRHALLGLVASRRALRRSRHWGNTLGQYSLLKSFDYRPRFHNVISRLSMRLMEPTRQGREREPNVQLRHEVKEAVLRSFKVSGGCLSNGRDSVRRFLVEEKSVGGLTNDRSSLDDDLVLACNLETHTHKVLVWHIATTMCDHKEAAEVSDEHRLVATSLSGYCAYLLAFVPGMLPDHSYAATQILDAVVEEAREHLGDSKDMLRRCEKMLRLGAGPHDGGGEGILNRGARLGRRLVAIEDSARRWKLLAEFWTELVLYLAPSDNTDVHAEYLARGGEFMTHLWTLLTHAGILNRDAPAPGTNPV